MSRYELRCIAYTINAINYAMLTYGVHASIVSCSSLSSLTTVYMLIAARQRCVAAKRLLAVNSGQAVARGGAACILAR